LTIALSLTLLLDLPLQCFNLGFECQDLSMVIIFIFFSICSFGVFAEIDINFAVFQFEDRFENILESIKDF